MNITESEFLDLNNKKAILYIPVSVYIGITMVFGMLGNSLVCYVYGCLVKPTTTTCFILFLGIYDLICCSVTLPMEIVEMRYPYYYLPTCKFQRLQITATAIASGFILLSIAIDRYICVCQPHKSKIEYRLAVKISIISALVALVLSIPVYFLYGPHSYEIDSNVQVSECSSDHSMSTSVLPQIYYGFLLILFVAILIPLSLLYIFIWQKLRRHKKSSPFGTNYLMASRNSFHCLTTNELSLMMTRGKSKSDPTVNNIRINNTPTRKPTIDKKNGHHLYKLRRTTMKLFLTTAFFSVSFIPYHILMIYRTIVGSVSNLAPLSEVLYNLFLRSYQLYTLNPTIYAVCDHKFWKEVSKLLPFCRCHHKDDKEDSEEMETC
ncbi:neurotensin receptor type 1-like [Argonauta hians]